jgi:protein gp37
MGQRKYAGLTKKVNGLTVWTGKINLSEAGLSEPLTWRKPRRVFVNSMSDLFHEGVPFDYIDRVFAVMALTPRHTYQVLTKRPERMAEYLIDSRDMLGNKTDERVSMEAENVGGDRDKPLPWPLANVWLGTSTENQRAADERIPHLLKCPAAVRFLSCEPLLGPIDLKPWLGFLPLPSDAARYLERMSGVPRLHWVIVGGESGPGARPCNVEWVRSIVGQCGAAGVACFVKQLGSVPTMDAAVWKAMSDIGPVPLLDHRGAKLGPELVRLHIEGSSKGGEMDGWPQACADLRVREFPEVPAPVPYAAPRSRV